MPTSEEPIIVQIVDETTKGLFGGSGGSKRESGGGSFGGAVGAIGAVTGIVDISKELLDLVKEAVSGILKPLKSVVVGVLKLVAQFLRPAIDILIMGIIPLMILIKPLVKVFSDIMRPFRQIAMSIIKQNPGSRVAGSAAQGVILAGLSTALMNVLGEFIKGNVSMILGVVKQIVLYPLSDLLGWFNRDAVDKAVSGIQDGVTSTIDTILKGGNGFKGINEISLDIAKDIGESFGVATKGINFTSAANSLVGSFVKSVNDATKEKTKQDRNSKSSIGNPDMSVTVKTSGTVKSSSNPNGITNNIIAMVAQMKGFKPSIQKIGAGG